ncbi:hypothetical protein GGR57DRAFT_506640 [Xylariaceae sp. FL1272]|nr:hypothetical protein GGR57DRAFT_506640 [Xylariaceae sp. FL1272]
MKDLGILLLFLLASLMQVESIAQPPRYLTRPSTWFKRTIDMTERLTPEQIARAETAVAARYGLTPEFFRTPYANLTGLGKRQQSKDVCLQPSDDGEYCITPYMYGHNSSYDYTPDNNNPYVNCHNHPEFMDAYHLDVATKLMSDYCDEGHYVQPGNQWAWEFRSARVAVCNHRWWWNPCHGSEILSAWADIDNKCPAQVDGDDEDNKRPSWGYWFTSDWNKAYFRKNCDSKQICEENIYDKCKWKGDY